MSSQSRVVEIPDDIGDTATGVSEQQDNNDDAVEFDRLEQFPRMEEETVEPVRKKKKSVCYSLMRLCLLYRPPYRLMIISRIDLFLTG